MALESRLAAIPFGALIGGPMNAGIEAQAKAALSSLKFIRAIGFDDNNNVQNIKFTYGVGDTKQELEVPLLTIVPIPYLRIDDMSIQFKANMSQATETEDKQSSSKEAGVSVQAGGKYLFFSAKMNASYSSKKDSSSTKNSKYAVEYTIDVNVHAVQDDMPAGMSRLLNILNEGIETQVKSSTGKK